MQRRTNPRLATSLERRHDTQTQCQTSRDPTPLPQWITESPQNYATLRRPLPESKTEHIYIYDRDHWDEPTIYDTNKLFFEIQVPNPET